MSLRNARANTQSSTLWLRLRKTNLPILVFCAIFATDASAQSCPQGSWLESGICQCQPSDYRPQCGCPPGMYNSGDGSCRCSQAGWTYQSELGRCAPPTSNCPPGMYDAGNGTCRCSNPDWYYRADLGTCTPRCPPGMTLGGGGTCHCPPGLVYDRGLNRCR
jgi:hypothetical protein